MAARWKSLAEDPTIRAAAYDFADDELGASFLQHDPVGDLITSRRIARHWPDHLLALVLDDGSVAARAVSVPFNAGRPGRDRLPATGWDGVGQWVRGRIWS